MTATENFLARQPSPPLKTLQMRDEKLFPCSIGEAPTKVLISDDFAVCVMTKNFFDSHAVKCSIHNTKETIINGVKFSKVLSTRVQNNVHYTSAEFFFTEELQNDFCVISNHVAKQIRLV